MKFRHTNFMRLIYATLLALPFVAILSRVIYVQSNKNAYQSAEITQTTFSKNEVENIKHFNTYQINQHINDKVTEDLSFSCYIYSIQDLSNNYMDFDEIFIDDNLTQNNYLLANFTITYQDSSLNLYIGNDFDINYINIYIDFFDRQIECDLLIQNVSSGNIEEINEYFTDTSNIYYEYNEVESTTLDNVFEYSINKFIQNNNFGKLNLFQWTTNLFFDSNDVNNMYVGFINWYLNYTLLVSATYILFLVLMWFINYARRLLERGMNYDW